MFAGFGNSAVDEDDLFNVGGNISEIDAEVVVEEFVNSITFFVEVLTLIIGVHDLGIHDVCVLFRD